MNILFINSKNFWLNGWLNTPDHLQNAIKVLESNGFTVTVKEISHVKELEQAVTGLAPDTLVWPNAYYTVSETGEIVWLQEVLERCGLPYVGTSAQGLNSLFHVLILSSPFVLNILCASFTSVPPPRFPALL